MLLNIDVSNPSAVNANPGYVAPLTLEIKSAVEDASATYASLDSELSALDEEFRDASLEDTPAVLAKIIALQQRASDAHQAYLAIQQQYAEASSSAEQALEKAAAELERADQAHTEADSLNDAASEALNEMESAVTDIEYVVDSVNDLVEEAQTWLAQEQAKAGGETDTPKSRRSPLRIKAFIDGIGQSTIDAILAADGGQQLWDDYVKVAAEIDAADAELTRIDAELETATSEAEAAVAAREAETGDNLDPSERSQIYATVDELNAERAATLSAKVELLDLAAELENQMYAIVN